MKNISKMIEIHYPVGKCNLACPYCYVGSHANTEIKKVSYTPDDIRKAFSKKRLGGYV